MITNIKLTFQTWEVLSKRSFQPILHEASKLWGLSKSYSNCNVNVTFNLRRNCLSESPTFQISKCTIAKTVPMLQWNLKVLFLFIHFAKHFQQNHYLLNPKQFHQTLRTNLLGTAVFWRTIHDSTPGIWVSLLLTECRDQPQEKKYTVTVDLQLYQ